MITVTNYPAVASQVIGLMLLMLIVWRTEPALNRMGDKSPPLMVRLSFALLFTGSVAGILFIIAGHVPDIASLLLIAGTAALTFCERRLRIITGHNGRAGLRGPSQYTRRTDHEER